jgi:hypothetical protein
VYLAGNRLPPAGPGSLIIEHRRDGLFPEIAIAAVGSVLTLRNADAIFHNLFSMATGNHFETGFLPRGAGRTVTLSASGVVPIFCRLHAQHSAVVVVAPSQWSVQVPGDANFVLANVPAGVHELVAWSRRRGVTRNRISVPDSSVVQSVVHSEIRWDRPKAPAEGGF